ncbi:vacuolar ATPase assembly integral membrane protein VMA21 isoform X4 [Canis lupus dingo]|uniref:vacuolar ATPase assembly integral membrane protein VMA21 isoform X4 n=1 Tax=Canis lupus dingo TaxID=286419 RepID=UPI0020C46E41|nr:vacuolar ATPase assembly integral membrane protein VMA21 isoform X4 [Canis lupus dingo]
MERLDKAALNALQPPDFRVSSLRTGTRPSPSPCPPTGPASSGLKCLLNESSLASTLKTLLFFTALMITVPIGLYFTTKSYVFEGAFGMSNRDSYFYAAIVAVVAVHVVLALFVYVAWNEGSRQWREGKQD